MKKYLYLILFFLVCVPAIAGTINSYTLKSPPDSADTVVIYDSDDGSTKKVTIGDVSSSGAGFTDAGASVYATTTTDNVAIGTTTPTQKLTVAGTVAATAFTGDGSALTGISGSGINWSSYPDLTALTAAKEFLVNNAGTTSSINWEVLSTVPNSSMYFNVKASPYNATGDGTTNDTAAIQAAFDAATVSGGTVFFPAGTYSVTNLTYYLNTPILGSGEKVSILKARAGTTAILNYTNTTTLPTPRPSEINRIGINCNSVASAKGIYQRGVQQWNFDHLIVNNCAIGVEVDGGHTASFRNSSIEDNVIGFLGGPYTVIATPISDNLILFDNINFIRNSSWALDLTEGSLIKLSFCDLEQNGTSGDASTGTIKYNEAGVLGMGLSIESSWFESFWGIAAIYIETISHVTAPTATYDLRLYDTIIDGHMTSGTKATYNIYSPVDAQVELNTSFIGINGGTRDIRVGGNIYINHSLLNNSPTVTTGTGRVYQNLISTDDNFFPPGNIGIGTSTASSGALIVKGGNVGIGTSKPFQLLEVTGSTAPIFIMRNTGSGGSYWGMSTTYNSSGAGPGKLIFMKDTTSSALSSVVFDGSNVGIGTFNPAQALQIGNTATGFQATSTGGLISAGNVGISTTAPTTCGCKQYTNGLCTTVGTCS